MARKEHRDGSCVEDQPDNYGVISYDEHINKYVAN